MTENTPIINFEAPAAKKQRPIYRDKIFIDPKIVSEQYTHAENHVEYYCYHEMGKSTKDKPYIPEDPVKEFEGNKQTYVCFTNLLDTVYASKKKDATKQYNRVLYHMTIDEGACIKLELEEQKRFIELSMLNKMLPAYVTPGTLLNDKEGKVVFMLEGLTPSLLYMYLSQYRYLREDPGFVRSILHLHDKCGFDFYAAFVVASRVSIDYTTHHFLTLQRTYGGSERNKVDNVTVPFSTIVGIRRFVRKPQEYDDRSAMNTNHGYDAATRIERICKVKYEIAPHELLHPVVKRAFSAMTDEITTKYLEQYKRIKDRIVYRVKEQTADAKSADSGQ